MKTKDTIKILEQQLDEAPHSPQLWEDLADLYLQREQVDKAIDAYEFALAIEPGRESALCKRSIAYLATDNPALHQKGKTYLETYSRQHPEQTELRDMLDRLNRLVDESMPSFLPSDDKETQEDSLLDVLVNDDSPMADRSLVNESLSREIDRALSTLTEREKEIIQMFFGIGQQEMTLEEIGDKFGLTRERVRQIKEKAIRRLRQSNRSKLLKSYLG